MNHDNKQLLFLSVTSFFAQMLISMLNLSLIYYLRDIFNYSPSIIALATASFSIAYVVFCMVSEKPTNNFSPRNTIFFSLLGMGLSIVLLLLSKTYLTIILSLTMYGAFMALLWPQMGAWYSRGREKKELNRAVSFFNLSWGFAMAVSPLLCGILTEINVVLPIYVVIISFIVLSIFVIIISNKVPYLKAVESESNYKKQNKLTDNSTSLRFISWAALFLAYFYLGFLLNIFPLYAREVLALSETKIGGLLWSRGLISCIAFFALGKMSFWHFKGSLIIIGQVALAVLSYMAIYSKTYFSLLILFTLFGFIFALIYMQSIFHGISGAINRTNRMVVQEVLLTSGVVLGAVFGGYIYEKINYERVMLDFSKFMFVFIILEMITYYVYLHYNSRKLVKINQFN
jgi:DHA1 family multidrug resistance protein-like MFS transporter/DHA1 family quinolone resistance protein-like MFS transporter